MLRETKELEGAGGNTLVREEQEAISDLLEELGTWFIK